MVRPSSSSSSSKAKIEEEDDNGKQKQQNPEAVERRRLKKLAFSNNLLSKTPAKPLSQLAPSRTVLKHRGKDILRKSQRRNRFLFSFPGLLAPISGAGKIGDLQNLGSKNPVLYVNFPQGQMKLFGTIVYPKNRYLTLHFSKGGKNVMCEDYFDNMIVFSEAWWIGRKEDNPEEARLDFPKELFEGQCVDCDFQGGAGAASINKEVIQKSGRRHVEDESLETEIEDESSDDHSNSKDVKEAVPVRQSERTASKTFKYVEVSSGDDSTQSDGDTPEEEEGRNVKSNATVAVLDNDSKDAEEDVPEQIQASAIKGTGLKGLSGSAVSLTTPKKDSQDNHSSLVQTTISTLFNKVQEKTEEQVPRNSRRSPSTKVSGQKLQHTDWKRKIDQVRASFESQIVCFTIILLPNVIVFLLTACC
uniref:DNA-binding protein RHL1 n=1 Tax=Rhizophora mucronata TaxID=61149 RepID=A0A2P2LD76_RHIMU